MHTIPKILCIMGPTASGKTDLALALCDKLPCDIISVDSALIYRGMDIGTAKPSNSILDKYPHKLIDLRDPAEPYSAADFCIDATREIKQSLTNQRIPLLVGGTMLYFKALQQGLAELPAADKKIRETLEQEAQEKGWTAMHARLKQIDPESAAHIHPNDPQRIQRALEIYALTGQTLSALQIITHTPNDFLFLNFALIPEDRKILHECIAQRFEHMLDTRFLEEVKKLRMRSDLNKQLPSMRCVGYRQAWNYLDGDYDEHTFKEKAIAATRQLAKRQLTWLRSWPGLMTLTGHSVAENTQKIMHHIR